jgi:hypothetical protein
MFMGKPRAYPWVCMSNAAILYAGNTTDRSSCIKLTLFDVIFTPCHFPCRWGETTSLNCDHQLGYCSSPRCYMRIESHCGIILTGENRRTRRKICPSATLFTTNPTRTDSETNPEHRVERQATNLLSHCMAWLCHVTSSASLLMWKYGFCINYNNTVNYEG